MNDAINSPKIAELNDRFRKATGSSDPAGMSLGKKVMTSGIRALGLIATVEIAERVAAFDSFTEDNDPHREHDFGSFEYDGNRIFWKIDYYVVLLLLLAAVWNLVRCASTKLSITDRRMVMTKGLFRRLIIEMHLNHLDAVVIRQSLLGRLCGYGKITMISAGGLKLPLSVFRPFILLGYISIGKPVS